MAWIVWVMLLHQRGKGGQLPLEIFSIITDEATTGPTRIVETNGIDKGSGNSTVHTLGILLGSRRPELAVSTKAMQTARRIIRRPDFTTLVGG
jgi:hypothetical protein